MRGSRTKGRVSFKGWGVLENPYCKMVAEDFCVAIEETFETFGVDVLWPALWRGQSKPTVIMVDLPLAAQGKEVTFKFDLVELVDYEVEDGEGTEAALRVAKALRELADKIEKKVQAEITRREKAIDSAEN